MLRYNKNKEAIALSLLPCDWPNLSSCNTECNIKHFGYIHILTVYTYRSTAMARKLKIEPRKDIQSSESITSSSLVSEEPIFSSCPASAKTSRTFSQVFARLAIVLKPARLHMKPYMGEWRFRLYMTATTTKRFSIKLNTPMAKKIGTGKVNSGQSVLFIEVFMIRQDSCSLYEAENENKNSQNFKGTTLVLWCYTDEKTIRFGFQFCGMLTHC